MRKYMTEDKIYIYILYIYKVYINYVAVKVKC